MTSRVRRTILAALFAGVTVLALACGGSDSDGGSDSSGGNNSSGGSANADLRLLGSDPIPSLDPALCHVTSCAEYIVEIFSGLVTIDKDLRVVPDLAEKWDVSPDGTVYTFFIRKDAKFQDGKPVTADDFKYSLDRTAVLGQTVSITAEAFLGDIVGAKDVTRGRAQSISGVKVIDSSTLQITIDGPKSYFIAKLSYPTAFVVDKQQVQSNPRNWSRQPNGSGPYKLVEWRLNQRIILEANANYVGGAPSVKRVAFNLAGGSSLTSYENNEIDVSGVSLNDIDRVKNPNDALNKQYVTSASLSIGYIGFNVSMAPFDDPKVRQAFAMAIDRNQIVHVILKDMVSVANSYMMPGLPGYNANAKAPEFNPTAAKQALAESKYKDAKGLGKITLTEVGGGATSSFDTQAVLEMLKQNLGVDVTIAQQEAATFFDDLSQRKLQMYTAGWIMDYPDPEDILDLLFYSTSRQNDNAYNNPQFDDLVLKARTEQDVSKRLLLYQQAEAILLQDVPWIPLYFQRDHVVVKPYVKGFEPHPMIIPSLKYVTIVR